MTPAETEKALRALFKKLRPPARAICHFPKPPQRREVCGFSIFYRGALVREYFGKELLKEFEITAREKGLMCPARQNPRKTPKKEPCGVVLCRCRPLVPQQMIPTSYGRLNPWASILNEEALLFPQYVFE